MPIESRHIIRLFSRMQHLFGHRWTSVYGFALEGDGLSASAKQWKFDLRDMTVDQVSHALRQCVDRGMEWPPNAVEFIGMCEGLPSLAQVLDRENSYGPICDEIRRKMNWYAIEGLSSSQVPDYTRRELDKAVCNLRGSGRMKELQNEYQNHLAIASHGDVK